MAEATKKSIKKPMILTIAALVIVFGCLWGWSILRSYFIGKAMAAFESPPQTVSTASVTSETWKPYLSAIGSMIAIKGVSVTPEIAGQVTRVYFQSGEMVKTGQPLIKLDTSLDEQDFKNYQAQYQLAKITYERQRALYVTKNASNADLDQARAAVQQDKAIMDKTALTIAKKTIPAPFSGKIGIREINVGQYVSPGDEIVTLQSLDPLYVNFTLPQQAVKSLYLNQPVQLAIDTYPSQTFSGKVTAINPKVDSQTRNILIQATIPNSNLKLLPGMFATIEIILPEQKNVLTVPQTAINYSLFGNSVFVLEPLTSASDNGSADKTTTANKNTPTLYQVKQVYVTTGEQRGSVVAVTKGLKAGDQVVSSGQLKLDNGSHVYINNSIDISKTTISNGQLY